MKEIYRLYKVNIFTPLSPLKFKPSFVDLQILQVLKCPDESLECFQVPISGPHIVRVLVRKNFPADSLHLGRGLLREIIDYLHGQLNPHPLVKRNAAVTTVVL